jgi:hypothetical protein
LEVVSFTPRDFAGIPAFDFFAEEEVPERRPCCGFCGFAMSLSELCRLLSAGGAYRGNVRCDCQFAGRIRNRLKLAADNSFNGLPAVQNRFAANLFARGGRL